MFGRIAIFVSGLGFLVIAFAIFVLVFSPTSLGFQNALPLPMAIFFSLVGTACVVVGICAMYDGIRRLVVNLS